MHTKTNQSFTQHYKKSAGFNKGNDASVKANLHTVKTQAAVFFGDNGNSYGTFNDGAGAPATCPIVGAVDASVFGNTTIEAAISAAIAYTPVGGVASCLAADTEYVVAVTRPAATGATPPSVYWCIDSTGNSCGMDVLPTGALCSACLTTD